MVLRGTVRELTYSGEVCKVRPGKGETGRRAAGMLLVMTAHMSKGDVGD